MSNDSKLENEIKQFIIDTLSLEDISPDSIEAEAPLFGEGLGLDSVDALEIGIALKKRYGILVDPKSEETRNHFRSVRELSRFIASNSKEGGAHGA